MLQHIVSDKTSQDELMAEQELESPSEDENETETIEVRTEDKYKIM